MGTGAVVGGSRPQDATGEITRALAAAHRGAPGAREWLWRLVYVQLRKMASRYQVRADDVLHQATDVVHAVFQALARQHSSEFRCRQQFFGFAAIVMRRVAVSWARAASRGGRMANGTAGEEPVFPTPDLVDLVALDEALTALAQLNPRCAKVVELRYFCGLESAMVAAELGTSTRTVEGDWQLARAWLRARLAPRDEASR
jgi:RNA polymerase sigma factor (TIGR02999 family)